MLWLILACTSDIENKTKTSEPSAIVEETKPEINPKGQGGPSKQIGPNIPNAKGGGPQGGPNGPKNVANGSGGAFQDPSGFPPFHDWKAPEGPAIDQKGDWTEVVQLTGKKCKVWDHST